MWENIQDLIASGDFSSAKIELSKVKADNHNDEALAILEATVCEGLGDYALMYSAIMRGQRINPLNYELYYLLGNYYLNYKNNCNQAFLCYENAAFLSSKQGNVEDSAFLLEVLNNLKAMYNVEVKNTAIIIASFNSAYLQQKNIESIRQSLPENTYRMVVVDNASTDGIDEWLAIQPDIYFLRNEENRGFSVACNQGVKLLYDIENDGEYDIFLLNNDTRLADNSLFWLRMGLYENDKIGATGAISNYAGNEQQIEIDFKLPKDYLEYGKNNNIAMTNPWEERVRLSGFAMLIRGKLWNNVGGMDEDFTPGYFEDDALSMEIIKRGYHLLLCRNSFIYHAGSQSFSQDSRVNDYLVGHHKLFANKYGFDILKFYKANEALLSNQITFDNDREFNVLEIGCGLGANMKWITTHFPNAHCIGVEMRSSLRNVVSKNEIVFESITELTNNFKAPVFDVMIINQDVLNETTYEERGSLSNLCKKGCLILPKNNPYKNFPFEKIKLVIWDLDDTFWKGTLSEGDIEVKGKNVALVKELSEAGIINSISSKNDEEPVKVKLSELEISDYFVFNNINWEDKGLQIKTKLEDMGLRAENVLFIDDNVHNLKEAEYHCENIMTATPDIIESLAAFTKGLNKSDIELSRLERYRLLEKKRDARNKSESTKQFLYDSDIHITINKNCMEEIDRITELVARTNQLNFTKNRDSKELLEKLISNDWNEVGYVKVSDRFGDYGIVGFYCYNTREKCMEHFLFSCRVIGMGIEQYVYNKLGCPIFSIKEPVASGLKNDVVVDWISEDRRAEIVKDSVLDKRVRILLKGPCDLSAIEAYLNGGNITTEFNYTNEFGFTTTGQNHSMHLWESVNLSKEEIESIVKEVPFIVDGDFKSKMFIEKYNVVCYSLLQDGNAGMYRNKKTGHYVAFSNCNQDITNQNVIDAITSGKEPLPHGFTFTKEILEEFAKNWEFAGRISDKDMLRNLEFIYNNLKGNPRLILILGSEKEYEKEQLSGYNGLCDYYRHINPIIRDFANGKDNITIIELSDYINSQDDYADCINHFSRDVYYRIADDIVGIINKI